MTTENDGAARQAAQGRVDEIAGLYVDMRAWVQVQLADCGPATAATPKSIMNKINELTSAHQLLLKAEEAYHEKFVLGGSHDPQPDLDAIRAEIGRRLDRLRDAGAEDSLSG